MEHPESDGKEDEDTDQNTVLAGGAGRLLPRFVLCLCKRLAGLLGFFAVWLERIQLGFERLNTPFCLLILSKSFSQIALSLFSPFLFIRARLVKTLSRCALLRQLMAHSFDVFPCHSQMQIARSFSKSRFQSNHGGQQLYRFFGVFVFQSSQRPRVEICQLRLLLQPFDGRPFVLTVWKID